MSFSSPQAPRARQLTGLGEQGRREGRAAGGQSHGGWSPVPPLPVPPGGWESAGDPHVPRTGPGRAGPGCVCARWETGNSGANVREKQLRSVRCGAGGALHAELGRVRPCCRERRDRGESGFTQIFRRLWEMPPWMRGGGFSLSRRSRLWGRLGAGCCDEPSPPLPSRLPQPGPQRRSWRPASRCPWPRGAPTPTSPLSHSHPNAVTCRVSRNHRMPRLERP